ncbi:hypothetical protein EB061_13355 [bacterium]|nr:hypothetical protein [bacterium]
MLRGNPGKDPGRIMDQYKTRQDIPEQYRWNLNLLYASSRDWEDDFNKVEPALLAVESHRGRLSKSADSLLAAFEDQVKLDLLIEKLYS